MFKKYMLVLFIIILSCPLLQAQTNQQPESEWVPLVIPAKLDPGSALNIGKLVLDAPAGKHGFVTVKDGHFYFEDGTRAKFWGTNLCFNACFPAHKQAEMLADRLAFFGFNAVRLHHMDYAFEPRGIFEDICPAYKDPQKKKTGTLSAKQMDRLDYLVYQLKLRGIYIDMNLLVSRHFTEADGVKSARELGMAAKPVSMFSPELIALQQQYAKGLLTHYNPYTKQRYCDDPVVALVEITNENSILASWEQNKLNGRMFGLKHNAIPKHYSQMLDRFWNDWLKTKYSTAEQTKKNWYGTNSLSAASSKNFLQDLAFWSLERHKKAVAIAQTTPNQAVIFVTRISDTPWHAQFRCKGIPIIKGRAYILRFSAKADKNTLIDAVCQQTASPWTNLGLSESLELSAGLQSFELPFVALEDCSNAKIGFLVGRSTATITFKDVSLSEAQMIHLEQETPHEFNFSRPLHKLRFFYPEAVLQDIKNFYTELQTSYCRQMIDFLKKDIGFRSPVTAIGGYQSSEDLHSLQNADYLDKHAYWDHPLFPKNKWDKNNFTIYNTSILQKKNLGFIGALIKSGKTANQRSKPFTVTEWNHCYPNQYAYETPLLLAAAAKQNEWDALFQFAFSHGWQDEPVLDEIQSFFDIMPNSQQLILCGLGSYIFLGDDVVETSVSGAQATVQTKGLHATIYSNENGQGVMVNFLPPDGGENVERFIGQIKNTNSGWEKGKFLWGGKPTLMKTYKTGSNFQ